MSYIQKAKEAKVAAEKAAAFDEMQKRQREQKVYALGNEDAYAAVEQELMRKAAHRQQFRPLPEKRYGNTESLMNEVGRYAKDRPNQGLAQTLVP